ncbi:TetR family transcriptional regulator [Alteromonadaceae bacterium 2753L.S.0a.02]|nr:TetR family transcriptional regulator [Alteromonadaceae bacterium 2753L.S.0a.02]
MVKPQTKAEIIAAADTLFYEQGFEHTSFSQIATSVGISRGNFYHHFKTKDDILDGVIQLRLARTNDMLQDWENSKQSPSARIRCFINILIMNRAKIKRFGCPVGTLSNELTKLDHPGKVAANKLFTLFRKWLRKQFIELGCGEESDDLAMHVLAISQGVATLASAYQDEKFINREVKKLCTWLAQIETSVS